MMPSYILFTESEAASRLGVSTITLRRERHEGRIGYLKIRARVRYSEVHLTDYLARNERCPRPIPSSELGNSFSENALTQRHGVPAGMIRKPDKQNEHLSAQMFFKRRK